MNTSSGKHEAAPLPQHLTKVPSELKQISFANNIDYSKEPEIDTNTPPRLRPAEISLDGRPDHLQVPIMQGMGTFIRQEHSPIKEYQLRDVEEPKVPPYRVYSLDEQSQRDKERYKSLTAQSFVKEPQVTTTQFYSACKEALCTHCVRSDDKKAEERMVVLARKHKEDLIDKFNRHEKASEMMADVVFGALGIGQSQIETPTTSKQKAKKAKEGQANQVGSFMPGILTGIQEEFGATESNSTDLISLDSSSHKPSIGLNFQLAKEDKEESFTRARKTLRPASKQKKMSDSQEQRRSSSLQANDFQAKQLLFKSHEVSQRDKDKPVASPQSIHASQSPDKISIASPSRVKIQNKLTSDGTSLRGRVLHSDLNVLKPAIKLQGPTNKDPSNQEHSPGVQSGDYNHFIGRRTMRQRARTQLTKVMDKADPLGDIERLSFYRLMQSLCAPNDQFYGCELNFVDTAFFDNKLGKANEIIFTNKEGFLATIKNEKKLTPLAIRAHMSEAVRERRRQQAPSIKQFYEEELAGFERMTSNNMRTTHGSDNKFSDSMNTFARAITSQVSEMAKALPGAKAVGSQERERSNTDFADRAAIRQSFTGNRSQLSHMAKQSSHSKKSGNSQISKKMEKTSHLDLAVIRFDVDPETLPRTNQRLDRTLQGVNEQNSAVSTSNMLEGGAGGQTNHNNVTFGTAASEVAQTLATQNKEPYQGGSFVKVANEVQFLRMMEESRTSRQWRAIECIQSCVKAQRGLGKHIPIKFTMQLDYSEQRRLKAEVLEADENIVEQSQLSLTYDYQEIGHDFRQEFIAESKSTQRKVSEADLNLMVEQRLKYQRPKDFCLRQVLKMCYYMQKLHEKEILQLNCDFYQDDNGEIWLFHATDILVRPQLKSLEERRQEKDLLEKQKEARERKQEIRRLEQAEWKEFKERLATQERKRRNIFSKQSSEVTQLKKQRLLRQLEKQAKIEQVKALGSSIGINIRGPEETASRESSQENNANGPQKALSAREFKIKQYAEQFHRYFLRQRKNLGIEKALENSDSEMDEALEKQVDGMLDAREKQEKEKRTNAHKKSILAMRKTLNRPGKANRSKNYLQEKRVANSALQVRAVKSYNQGADYTAIPYANNLSQHMNMLQRTYLNSRQRSDRLERVIIYKDCRRSAESHQVAAEPPSKDYQPNELTFANSGSLKGQSLTQLQSQSHTSQQDKFEHLDPTTKNFLKILDQGRSTFTHLPVAQVLSKDAIKTQFNTNRSGLTDGGSVLPTLEQAFKLKPGQQHEWNVPFNSQTPDRHTKPGSASGNSSLQNIVAQMNKKATLMQQAAMKASSHAQLEQPIFGAGNLKALQQKSPVTQIGFTLDSQHNRQLQDKEIGQLPFASLKSDQKSTSTGRGMKNPVSLRKYTTVNQVRNTDGSASIVLNLSKGEATKAVDSGSVDLAKIEMPSETNLDVPKTNESSRRVLIAGSHNQAPSFGRQSRMTLDQSQASTYSWQPVVNLPASDEVISLGETAADFRSISNAYFNLNSVQALKGRSSMVSQAREHQRSVSPGRLYAQPGLKAKSYLRSIDRDNQEKTHFFHMPESTSAPQRTTMTAGQKVRSLPRHLRLGAGAQSRSRAAVQPKKDSIVVKGTYMRTNKQNAQGTPRIKQRDHSTLSSRHHLDSQNRTTMPSRYDGEPSVSGLSLQDSTQPQQAQSTIL